MYEGHGNHARHDTIHSKPNGSEHNSCIVGWEQETHITDSGYVT